jgi:hypothetical protein
VKKFISSILIVLSQAAWSEATPFSVVNERMKAYNAYDLELFLSLYSDDIKIFTYPNKQLGKGGKDQLKDIFEPMFKEAKVSVVVNEQITQGNYVINNETVTYSDGTQKYVSIYEVEGGLIKSVQFIRD